MHADPLIYFRTARPLDITTFGQIPSMTGRAEDRVTYPIFFKGPKGEMLFRYRDGGSGNGVDYYNIYDTKARAWNRLIDKPLLDGEGACNAYAILPRPGPDKLWHMIWMWRDTPDCATNHDLAYARSPDLIHWTHADGTPVTLPLTRANGDTIDPTPIKGGLINPSQHLGFDSAARPLVTYHRYDGKGRSQAYIARHENGAWRIRQISAWDFRWDFSGGGSIPRGVSLGSARRSKTPGQREVRYDSPWTGPGKWVLDENTLEVVATIPDTPGGRADPPRQNIHPTALVKTTPTVRASDGKRYQLRWETLPANRDRPHGFAVPPTVLELVALDP